VSEDDPISDDALTARLRVYQRVRGHRYSIDDVATAWEAARERPLADSACDLGCGIGSVLLMVADRLPQARMVGIEAQEISFQLARRNVERNDLEHRVELICGDLREVTQELGRVFPLVTGTPPYFDPKKASPSTDSQRTYARIEMRGGLEDYVAAGAKVLAPGGVLVVCGDAQRPERAREGARRAGLYLRSSREIVPRRGKHALFAIWTFTREPGEHDEREPLVLREADGARTEVAHQLREFFGLQPSRSEEASPPTRIRRR
jgi:tRNA1Val (adenine37-N6)-methyltransferase